MAPFNIVFAATEGYREFWQDRRVFLRLGLLPVAIKMAGFVAVMSFGLEANYLRQGLVLLPSYFLEGWLVAVAIRLMLFRDMLPSRQLPENFLVHRDIMGGMVIYVLTKLVATFLSSYALTVQNSGVLSPAGEPDPLLLLAAFIIMVLSIWAFRFFWLYVPVTMGIGVREFLVKIKPLNFSIYLVGFWLLCFVPFAVLLVILSEIFKTIFSVGIGEPGLAYIIAVAVAQAVIELCVILVSGLGFAYAVRNIMKGEHSTGGFFR